MTDRTRKGTGNKATKNKPKKRGGTRKAAKTTAKSAKKAGAGKPSVRKSGSRGQPSRASKQTSKAHKQSGKRAASGKTQTTADTHAEPSRSRESAALTSPAPSLLCIVPLVARWRDLDAFNHVNNSTYLTYLEEARLQWLRTVPGRWFDAHSMPVMAASELNYRAPINWPAELRVELFCERLGQSSLTLGHRIRASGTDEQLYCDGHVVLVWVDPASGASVDLPQAIRDVAVPKDQH